MSRRGALVGLAWLVAFGGGAAATAEQPPSPGSAGGPVPAQPYSLSARQAEGVDVIVRFLDAFNRRELDGALAQFAARPDSVRFVGVSDCDYRRVEAQSFQGRAEVTSWLRQRFADRDRLRMSGLRLIDDRGTVVGYSRRTSRTIAALGFPDGIEPQGGTKVGFTTRGPVRITQFANAPAGDRPDHEACRLPERLGPASEPWTLAALQAAEISVVVRFMEAFNTRNLPRALSLLGPDIGVSDCDYRRVAAVEFQTRRAVAKWLRQRFADRDRLTVARLYNENPDQPTGVMGVEYERRTSNTLRALGFANGIHPQGGTKIALTRNPPVRISRFANGPVGGPRALCRPSVR